MVSSTSDLFEMGPKGLSVGSVNGNMSLQKVLDSLSLKKEGFKVAFSYKAS